MDRFTEQMDRPRDLRRLAFVAESTLGRLAKWLRLAGFDTLYDTLPPQWRRLRACALAGNRVVLTRTRHVIGRLEAGRGLLIEFDAPIEQVRLVLDHYQIRRGDLEPLSRCSRCNTVLRPAQGRHLLGTVPDYVRQHHKHFMMCVRCGRIYWPGTHCSRMAGLIERWFSPGGA
jgi:uncharacterized protein with PIN domain